MSGVPMRRGVSRRIRRRDHGTAARGDSSGLPEGTVPRAPARRSRVVGGVWRGGPRDVALLGACGAGAAAACVVGFRSSPEVVDASARAALETAVGLTALLTSVLLALQLRMRRRMLDLLLLSALISVALVDVVFSALPAFTTLGHVPYGIDARMVLAAMVPITFAIAGLSSRSRVTVRQTWHVVLVAAACLLLFCGIEVLDALTGRFVGHTEIPRSFAEVLGGAEAVGFFIAALAFAAWNVQSSQGGLLAGVCLLLAGARIYAIAVPAASPDALTLRDPLRMAAYVLLLVAVAADFIAFGRSRQEEAVRVERERIARDIHDGLAQDLATIALHAQRLEAQHGAEHPLTVAARRALAASRSAIVDLSASHAPNTVAALRAVGDELEARFGIEVIVVDRVRGEAGGRADLAPGAREQIVRIAREAIVNAARHGAARHVEVALHGGGTRWSLRVTDDGLGIPDAVARGAHGFGLGAMRARAGELEGELVARRHPGGGTVIEVSVPTRTGD